MYALGASGVSLEQYEVTFEEHLNEALSGVVDCSFNITPIYSTVTMFSAFSTGHLDFAFVDPSIFACLSVSVMSVCQDAPDAFAVEVTGMSSPFPPGTSGV